MIFSLLVFVVIADTVGLWNYNPYFSQTGDGIIGDILKQVMEDIKRPIVFKSLDNQNEGEDCLLIQQCDMIIQWQGIGGQISYPIFYVFSNQERPVSIVYDQRGGIVADIFWQYLVLAITLWLPFAIILAHFGYFFQSKIDLKQYSHQILQELWSLIACDSNRHHIYKIWMMISGVFLAFIFALIIADLATLVSEQNYTVGLKVTDLYDLDVCSSQLWASQLQSADVKSAQDCLNQIEEDKIDAAVIGRAELGANNDYFDKDYLILRESLGFEAFFTLKFHESYQFAAQINQQLQYLWQTQQIFKIVQNHTQKVEMNRNPDRSFILQNNYLVFTGISILVIFVALLIFNTIYKLSNSKVEEDKSIDPPKSQRSLLQKYSNGNTLSLQKSDLSDHFGVGRPDGEWVDRAIDIHDKIAVNIRNMNDYENELSAVPDAQPSYAASESLVGLFNSNA